MTNELDSKMTLLGGLPLFGGCTPTELLALARAAYPIAFDQGDLLCAAGSDAPECYVVTKGVATVTVGSIEVDRVEATEVVGERGPITGRPRAATVRAATPMLTYAIPREEIVGLMERSPVAAVAMKDELLRRYG